MMILPQISDLYKGIAIRLRKLRGKSAGSLKKTELEVFRGLVN